jgi:hypothetical protein
VTSRLGTGKPLAFFYSVSLPQDENILPGLDWEINMARSHLSAQSRRYVSNVSANVRNVSFKSTNLPLQIKVASERGAAI